MHRIPDPVMDERGTPVGRRVFLGLVGLGAAGVLLGARAQDWLERAVGPLIAKDGTGLAVAPPDRPVPHLHRHRRPPVAQPRRLPAAGRRPRRPAVHALLRRPRSRCRPPSLTRDFQCVTGWRVPDVAVEGRAPRRRARPRRRAARSDRGALHTRSTARTPRASRSSRRGGDDVIVAYELEGDAALRRARRPGAPLRRADVRLQVAQVARPHRAHRRTSKRATGRCAATTSTDGSAGRTDATTMPPDAAVTAARRARRPSRRSCASTASNARCTG